MIPSACLVLVVAGLPVAAGEATSVPTTAAAGLLFVEVEVAGRPPLLALLDTGASASAIDPRCSGNLPVVERSEVVGTTGAITVDMVVLEGLRLGSLSLPALRATRRDLSGLIAPPERKVDMILGSDALARFVVTIDFEAKRLELAREPAAGLPDGVPMTLDNGIPCIAGSIGGLDVGLRIDTGASLFETSDVYVNIPTKLWKALRERQPDLAPSTSFKGTDAGGESVDLPVAAVRGARIGPLELKRVFVIVQPEAGYFADPSAKGFVSNNFLRKLGRVTLDYGKGRMHPGSG